MDPIKKVEKDMEKEMHRQIHIYYSAASLALHRHDGWGKARIAEMYSATQNAWNECAKDNTRSMVQMLEDETGIELRNEHGKSWHDLCFLNNAHPANRRTWTRGQFLLMRQEQLKWVGTNTFACILLAMHRRYGFGIYRLSKLVEWVIEIREEFDFNERELLAACQRECGVNIEKKEDTVL